MLNDIILCVLFARINSQHFHFIYCKLGNIKLFSFRTKCFPFNIYTLINSTTQAMSKLLLQVSCNVIVRQQAIKTYSLYAGYCWLWLLFCFILFTRGIEHFWDYCISRYLSFLFCLCFLFFCLLVLGFVLFCVGRVAFARSTNTFVCFSYTVI